MKKDYLLTLYNVYYLTVEEIKEDGPDTIYIKWLYDDLVFKTYDDLVFKTDIFNV